jgi:hypothetical protein
LFLSAAFLLGLVTLLAPWWLHRLRVHTRVRRVVSSLYLMRASEAPVQMQKRLQHLMLMALRMALLAAVVLAFARPSFTTEAEGDAVSADSALVLVIDTSLSMDRGHVFTDAIVEARGIVNRHPHGTQVAIITASDEVTLDLPLTSDPGAIDGALSRTKPGQARLVFDGLAARVDQLVSGMNLKTPVSVHLISDFQANALPDTFNALLARTRWPMELHPVGGREANWGIAQVLLERSQAAPGLSNGRLSMADPSRLNPASDDAGTDRLVVTVRGYQTPSAVLEVTAQSEKGQVLTTTTEVGDNGASQVSFNAAPGSETWTVRLTAIDATQADSISRDNVYFVASPSVTTASLPVLSAPAPDTSPAGKAGKTTVDPVRYFTTAVTSSSQRFAPVRISSQLTLNEVTPVLAMIDPGGLSPTVVSTAERYLRAGGAVFMTVGPETVRTGRLPLLESPISMDRFDQTVRSIVVADDTHPVLRQTRWDTVSILQRVTLDQPEGARPILSTGDGEPLLLEYRIGAGRLLLLLTALDPGWSTMVIEPGFVQFVDRLLGYLAEDILPVAAVVGEPMVFPALAVQLFDPEGRRVLGLSDTVERPNVRLSVPGQYQVRTPGGTRPLAVNIPAAESDLEPAPDSILTRWQQSMGTSTTDAAVRQATATTNASQGMTIVELAPWLIGLVLILALLEPLIANGLPQKFT